MWLRAWHNRTFPLLDLTAPLGFQATRLSLLPPGSLLPLSVISSPMMGTQQSQPFVFTLLRLLRSLLHPRSWVSVPCTSRVGRIRSSADFQLIGGLWCPDLLCCSSRPLLQLQLFTSPGFTQLRTPFACSQATLESRADLRLHINKTKRFWHLHEQLFLRSTPASTFCLRSHFAPCLYRLTQQLRVPTKQESRISCWNPPVFSLVLRINVKALFFSAILGLNSGPHACSSD
jgi:hypothetical protein